MAPTSSAPSETTSERLDRLQASFDDLKALQASFDDLKAILDDPIRLIDRLRELELQRRGAK